jgi:hypothetical protein
VLARRVRNKRLYDALDQWAFCTLTRSPGARAFYDQHRANGDTHQQALRALGNDSSASCTAVYATTGATTNTKHAHTEHPQPLDNLRTWDV